MRNKRVLSLSILLFLIFETSVAYSQTLSNEDYIIQMGNLNSFAGESEGSGYNISITGGQNGPGLYSGTNYKVKSGFQYVRISRPFTFAISQTVIDFGTLTPTNPVVRSNTLTISNESAANYSVTASENHQLTSPSSGTLIPDTTCDKGTCSQTTASAWTSTLTYGFGYRCDKIETNRCASGFSDSSYFKQFPDASKSESAQIVMNGKTGKNQQTEVSYKVNISSSQQAGQYTNTITYIATPGF